MSGSYADGCPHQEERRPSCNHGGVVLGALIVAVVVGFMVFFLVGYQTPRYSADIDSVAGLDNGDLLSRHSALDPFFNVTLRATSRGFLSQGCFEAGSVVDVSYAGVPLATGPVLQGFCSPTRGHKEEAVVVWGTAVQVPGFALDRLAVDARRGTPVFDVAIRMPSTHANNHEEKLVSCLGLRVGDAAALGAPCAVTDVDTASSRPSDRGA